MRARARFWPRTKAISSRCPWAIPVWCATSTIRATSCRRSWSDRLGADYFERAQYFVRPGRPHQSCSFPAILEEHKCRPEPHAERAAEGLAAGVAHLDVPYLGMLRKRVSDHGLCAAAIPAPACAELEQYRPRQR